MALILGATSPVLAMPRAVEPAVRIELGCPALSTDAEQEAAFEARALVELAVRRHAAGVLELRCDAAFAVMAWKSAEGSAETRVAVNADPKLFVDALVAALWLLDIAPHPPQPAVVPRPRDPGIGPKLALSAGGQAELWPDPASVLPGARLGVVLRGSAWWSIAAFGMLAAGLEDVDGIEIAILGAGVVFDARPFPIEFLELGLGSRGSIFSARAPVGLEPRDDSAAAVSAFARARLVYEWSTLWIALGPELIAYALRPRVLIADEQVLTGPWFTGGVGLDLGWTFWSP